MKSIFSKLWAFVALALLAVGCATTDEPTPEPPTPQEDFVVELGDVTRSIVSLSVTPAESIGDYICVVEERGVVDEFTQDKFVIATVLQELGEEASSKGLTLAEYLPSVVDNGTIENATFSGLKLDTEYYVLVFGVDTASCTATTELTKVAFKTLAVEKRECTFEVATEVVDNSVTISVSPSDEEVYWYLCTMPKSTYDYYVNDENGYKMSEDYFYEYYFQQDINAYRGAGYSDEQIIDALIHQGSLQLQASGLNEYTEYYILVAGLIMDSEGIVICTDVARGDYSTEGAAQSAMTFEIKVWDIGQMEASFSITPSNNNDKYCALVAPWDGVTEAQDMMHKLVEQWAGWMDVMADDRGPVEHSGSTAMRLPAADTDYYIIAFGYDGGITTEATMATFRTLPGGSVEDVVFEVTASSITPYGFTMNVKSSDSTIYYVPGLCTVEEYDEATFVGYENETFAYYFEQYKSFNPAITIAEILDQYYYNGNATLQVSGLQPDSEYLGYIYALDVHSGEVVKCFTFPAFARTAEFSTIAPKVELVGYYSGDDEAGTVFDDANATKGRAITVVKYTDIEDVRTLFTTMVDGDCSNAAAVSDGELWQLTQGYWKTCKTSEPYSFYLADWNVVKTALCYATDNDGMLSPMSRLYTCPTAENKSDIAELQELVNEINNGTRGTAAVELLLPKSVVVDDAPASRVTITPVE